MDYETLNEQEWLALLTEMAKADNVIKEKLAKVLVNKSEFFSRQDKVDSYKIKRTHQGDLIFDVRWQTLANFGDTTQYEYVTMGSSLSLFLRQRKILLMRVKHFITV